MAADKHLYGDPALSDLDDYKIDTYKRRFPTHLKIDHYDSMILYSEYDKENVLEFLERLNKKVLLFGKYQPKVALYDEIIPALGMTPIGDLDVTLQHCTYVLLYVTKNFVEDAWTEFSGQVTLMDSINNGKKRWSVIPIFTEPKRGASFKIPASIRGLKGTEYLSPSKFPTDSLRAFLEDKLHARQDREKKQRTERVKWIMEQRENDKIQRAERLKWILEQWGNDKMQRAERLKWILEQWENESPETANKNQSSAEEATDFSDHDEQTTDDVEYIVLPPWRTRFDADEMDGWTSLHLACYYNRFGDVQGLVETHREDENVRDKEAEELANNLQQLRVEEEENDEETTEDVSGNDLPSTSADDSAKSNKPIMFRNAPSCINAQTEDGETPLFVACEMGHVRVVRKLLAYDLDVDLHRNDGTTPLLTACSKGHASVVRVLLLHKADVFKSSADGKTPLDIALEMKHEKLVELLLTHIREKITSHPNSSS